MNEELEALQQDALDALSNTQDMNELQQTKVHFLAKKGCLTGILREMGKLSKEERPVIGEMANHVRESITEAIELKSRELEEKALEKQLENEAIDVTLPGRPVQVGGSHLLTNLIEEIEDLFIGMGFEVREGPEVETDFFNFEALNLPKGHPARDMQDTFYITNELLLRTQTSTVQERTMLEYERGKPVQMK